MIWSKTVIWLFSLSITQTEHPLFSSGYLRESARVNEVSCRARLCGGDIPFPI